MGGDPLQQQVRLALCPPCACTPTRARRGPDAGSSVDAAPGRLAQRIRSGNVPAADLTAPQDKTRSSSSMDTGQVFRFWVPSIRKTRFLLLENSRVRWSFLGGARGQGLRGQPLSFCPRSDRRLCFKAKGSSLSGYCDFSRRKPKRV